MDYNDSAYDAFLKEAATDNRVGDHDWLVSDVQHDTWPSGDPRIKIKGQLITAGERAMADMTISPPPSLEVIKAESSTWDTGKKKAIANAIEIHRQLAKHYGTTPEAIEEGQVYRVKTTKTKVNADGTGGFIRVVAFKPRADTTAEAHSAHASIPF